jgi:hypothetical protein
MLVYKVHTVFSAIALLCVEIKRCCELYGGGGGGKGGTYKPEVITHIFFLCGCDSAEFYVPFLVLIHT